MRECVEDLVRHARSRGEDSVPAIELTIAIESLIEAKVLGMMGRTAKEEP